jgi:hypothetical protein
MTTTGRITVIRFSLCCLLCVSWSADAVGQSPPTARDTQMLKRYTKGVVCDPQRLKWLPELVTDSTTARCELGIVALRALGAGRAKAFGIGPSDTASVRCALFFDAAFQLLTAPGGHPGPGRADRSWAVILLTRKGPVDVRFDRWRAQIRVYPEDEGPMLLPRAVREACGLDESTRGYLTLPTANTSNVGVLRDPAG